MKFNTAAVIIDQWDDSLDYNFLTKESVLADRQYQLVNNIKEYITSHDNIDLIILASYSIKSECLQKNDYNKYSLEILGNELYKKKIKFLQSIDVPEEYTDSRLIEWKIKKKKISMHFPWELAVFLKKHSIKDFFICGSTFDFCVRDRPLGYEALYKFINNFNLSSKIFTKSNLVLKEDDSFLDPEKDTDWTSFNLDIFYYDPKD